MGGSEKKFPTYCQECGERLDSHDDEYKHYIIGFYRKTSYGEGVYGKHCKRLAYKVETMMSQKGKGYQCPRCDKFFDTHGEMKKHLYKEH